MVPRFVVIGAGGRLGAALVREYSRDGVVRGFGRAELDLTDLGMVRRMLGKAEFDVLINCAALTNVDYCESHTDEAFRINAEAPGVMAEICAQNGARFVHISTDYVFDGTKPEAYTEEDAALPISVYGQSKLRGEQLVLAAHERALVARVSWVFGPDRPSFVDAVLRKAREEERVAAVADKFSTPTYTLDIASMLRPFVGSTAAGTGKDPGYGGVLHLTNSGGCSWQEYAQYALDCCRERGVPMKAQEVARLELAQMKNFVARRPVNTVLSNAKFSQITAWQPRHWREAVASYIGDYVVRR